jgi:hypothetical protein
MIKKSNGRPEGLSERPSESFSFTGHEKDTTHASKPSTTNHQDEDKESLRRQLKMSRAITRDMSNWISHRWGRLSEESTYSHPQLERSLKFTREVFDCGYEVLTVSSLVDGERGGEA